MWQNASHPMLPVTRASRAAAPPLQRLARMNETVLHSGEAVLIAPASDGAEWDAFVEQTHGSTFCHLWGWRDVVESVMGQEAVYFAARDEAGAVRGVLPLVRLRSPLFGVRHVSMPYLNDGGPIGDAAAVRALREHAVELSAAKDIRLELRTREAPAEPTTAPPPPEPPAAWHSWHR